MRNRIISFIMVVVILLTITPFSNVVATPVSYDEVGHISVRVVPQNSISHYKALLVGDEIYLSANDISTIAGFNIMGNEEGAPFFYRYGDWMTVLQYFEGHVYTMGHRYEMQTIIKEGQTYFDVEKMLYLLHAQWVVEDSVLIVQPMGGNLFEFWYRNIEYIEQNAVRIDDLLLNGENIWTFSLRTTLANLFTDINVNMFWPPARIRADYQDALFLLLQEDTAFFDEGTIGAIDSILENSNFEGIISDWESIYNIAGLPGNITGIMGDYNSFVDMFAPSLRFNAWNDIAGMDFGILTEITDVMGGISDVLDFYGALSNIVEIYTRSQNWGEDFISYITLLSSISETRYGENGGHIRAAAQSLVDEKSNPIRAARMQAYQEIADIAIGVTPAGKFLSVVSGAMSILQSVPEINTQIETASMQYTINRLIHVEQIARAESTRYYIQHSRILSNRTVSDISPWMMHVFRENSVQVEERSIQEMRSAMMLHLRTTLRNRYFMYQFYINESVNRNIDPEVARAMRQNLYSTYALLIEFMNTEQYDRVLVLDSNLSNRHNNEWGRMQVEIPAEIFREGEGTAIDVAFIQQVYMEFLRQRAFQPYVDNTWWNDPITEYAIIDINGDGVPELIISSADGFGWYSDYIFTYDLTQESVVYRSSIYRYISLQLSQKYNALVFSTTRSTERTVYFYSPNITGSSGNIFSLGWYFSALSHVRADYLGDFWNSGIYEGSVETIISEEEFQRYFDDLIEIEFLPIPIDSAEVPQNQETISISDDWKEWFSIPYVEWFGDNPPEAEWFMGVSLFEHPTDSESGILFFGFEDNGFIRLPTDYPVGITLSVNRLLGRVSISVEELRDIFGETFSMEWNNYWNAWDGRVEIDGFVVIFLAESEHDTNIRWVDIWRE